MNNEPAEKRTTADEIQTLDLYSKSEAEQRTRKLLRAMLSTPPTPFTPKKKANKRAKK